MQLCPSCQTYIDESLRSCSKCGYNLEPASNQDSYADSNSKGGQLIVHQGRRPKLPVHVYLAVTIDRTESSKEFEKGIPESFITIAKIVEAKARKVSFYVATHGDRDEGQEFMILSHDVGKDQAISDVNDIVFAGGGVPHEHHLDALESLIEQIPWGAGHDIRSAAIAFMTADSKPATSGRSPEEIGDLFKQRGIELYLVCQPTPTLHSVVKAASGLLFKISNNPDVGELQSIAANIAKSITQNRNRGTITATATS